MVTTDGFEGPLAEYNALRTELEARFQRQHQIHTLQLAAVAAIFSFGLANRGNSDILLVIPYVSYLLCGRHTSQTSGVVRISAYLREHLSDKIPGGLHWEQWTKTHRRNSRFTQVLLPMLLSYPGAGIVALCWTADGVFTGPGLNWAQHTGLIVLWSRAVIVTVLSIRLLIARSVASRRRR